MALQTSGTISFANLQTEFTGSHPIGFNEYYKDGSYVPSTVAVAAGSYSGYSYSKTTTPLYYLEVSTTGTYSETTVYWNNTSYDLGTGNLTTGSNGGYDYNRGDQKASDPGDKNNPTAFVWYEVRRRTSATTVTVNANIPTSGQISMNNMYGGRKT